VAQLGAAAAILINGVFGDPLLHLRLRQHRRSLLFDLGEAVRLPARIAHQVSDVFVTHAHMDHIGGFLWFLRSRIGEQAVCRLYGPPGLAEHIRGMVTGILWDRIGDQGPCFEVAELHGDRLHRWRVQAGVAGMRGLNDLPAIGGLLRDEPTFRVRAATLDHGTPVLAFAYEPADAINVDKAGLEQRGLSAGPWVGELKRRLAAGDRGAVIHLPDGSQERVSVLASALLRVTPGQKLAYATDLADTLENRTGLVALASGAHTFFCEAGFVQEHVEQARATGHLTARACGEIATAAHVERLIPFHFSRRYEASLDVLYREVRSACSCTLVPEGM
jgi:ribonuclease BN (tRNA processing enzyme)